MSIAAPPSDPLSAGLCRFPVLWPYKAMQAPSPDRIAVFDRRAVRLRRDRAARREGFDFLFIEAAERLLDRLGDVDRRFPVALDLGCRDGLLGRARDRRGGIVQLVQVEASPAFA